MDKAKYYLRLKARDNARTPMQWDSTSNGGFCPAGVKPWMRVNDDYPVVNAAIQRSVPRGVKEIKGSMLVTPYRFWQAGLEIRKQYVDLFTYGDFEIIWDAHPTVFAFKRMCDKQESITILNFSSKDAEFTVPPDREVKTWCMGSYDAVSTEKPKTGVIRLLPWEGLLGVYTEKQGK
jgi:oligo-1,6-glucosidase